jgi:uncharacterized protein
MERLDIQFISEGLRCAGWFYNASDREKAPCIVLGHGFGGTREMRLDAYAEAFARVGYHALVFDYRHFGGSEGDPRQILDIKKQQKDWKSAIHFARGLDGVDPDKIILWGTSFSGGHVIPVAIEDGAIKAVISQVPNLSGLATTRATGVFQGLRLGVAAWRDMIRKIRGKRPYYIKIVGDPGELAAMTAPGAYDGVQNLFPEGYIPNEDVAARIILHVGFYSPGRLASKMTMPWLVLAAQNDTTTPVWPAIKAAMKAPKGQLIMYKCGHFDVYVQPNFDETIQDQIRFLKIHVN